jgi:hypothetical protein
MYSHQHDRLYKTVKLHQYIMNLINFTIEHRFDWEYLTVLICHAVVRTTSIYKRDVKLYVPKNYPFTE